MFLSNTNLDRKNFLVVVSAWQTVAATGVKVLNLHSIFCLKQFIITVLGHLTSIFLSMN